MRITICAVGRLKAGPEKTLIDDYLTRFDRTGRALALGPAQIIEIDERGRTLSSPSFAKRLAGWRDDGCRDLALLIGGADGLDPSLRAQADFSLSFGTMVWPHMLVRVMLSEQLYRAANILAGGPYHRA